MNRREFFKALTGAASMAVTGIPASEYDEGSGTLAPWDYAGAENGITLELIEDMKRVFNEANVPPKNRWYIMPEHSTTVGNMQAISHFLHADIYVSKETSTGYQIRKYL